MARSEKIMMVVIGLLTVAVVIVGWGQMARSVGTVWHDAGRGFTFVTGCESRQGTGFCAPLRGNPVMSWDHGPGGHNVTVGPIGVTVTRSGGILIDIS